ncbi:MAG: undecaprenyl-diphosphate phosphatase [Chloroflexota bacterium]|nr:undecaprenyl-diphosphate phosphatase [Chloroflexota bacterium]
MLDISVIHAALLGFIQGLTEFLPVSSSGHLAIVSKVLEYNTPGLLLEASVHIGTALAILIYFRKRIAFFIESLVRNAGADMFDSSGPHVNVVSRSRSVRLLGMLTLSFLCTCVVAMLIKGWATYAFDMPIFVGTLFVGTAIILGSTRFIGTQSGNSDLLGIGIKVAILVGVIQGLAVFPGVSRSGVTIVAALWAGQNNQSAAEYSFFLAIPTIIAASIYSFWNVSYLSTDISVELVLAAVVALVSGLIAIHWLMLWMRQGRLWWFSGYCMFVGVISIAGSFMGII